MCVCVCVLYNKEGYDILKVLPSEIFFPAHR